MTKRQEALYFDYGVRAHAAFIMIKSIVGGVLALFAATFGLHQAIAPSPPTSAPVVVQTAAADQPFSYSVQPGDTIFGIATSFGISENALVSANALNVRAPLKLGRDLVIPTAAAKTASGAASQKIHRGKPVPSVSLTASAAIALGTAPEAGDIPQTDAAATAARGERQSRDPPSGGVATTNLEPAPAASASAFATKSDLAALAAKLQFQIASINPWPASGPSAPITVQSFAPSQRIDNLSNITVSGVSGLTASDIPSLPYLPISGGTVSGLSQFSNASTSLLSVTGTAYFGDTATSTFGTDGSLTLNGALIANADTTLGNATSTNFFTTTASSTNLFASSGQFGSLNLASPLGVLSGGTGWTNVGTGAILFGNGVSALGTSSSLFWDNPDGRLGIGTTTPQYALTVAGSAYADTLTTGSSNGVLVVGSVKYPTLASAVAACPTTGCSIYVASPQTIPAIVITKTIHLTFAPGRYTVTGTIAFQNDAGVVFEGAGVPNGSGTGGTEFNWAGNSTDPMLALQGVRQSEFDNFKITSGTSVPLATAIDIPRYSGGGITTGNDFEDIAINGTNGGVQYGFRLGEGVGNNQVDFQKFTHVEVDNYSVAAWSIEFSQAKLEQFIDCAMNSDGYGSYGITTALNGSSGGSFSWINGGGGGNTVADFYLGSPDDSISINGAQLEGSYRMLVTTGASANAWPITIENTRWAGDGSAQDGEMIIYTQRGPLNLIGNYFGDGTTTVPLQINIQTSGNMYANATGNQINTTLSNPFTGTGTWSSIGNQINNAPPTLLANSFANNLAIGTTTADQRLSIFSNSRPAIEWTTLSGGAAWTEGIDTGNGNAFEIASSTALGTNPRFVIDGSGNVGIGTTSPATNLSVAGNSYFTGGLGVGLLNTTAGSLQTSGLITGGSILTLNGTSGTTTLAAGQGFTIGGSQFVLQPGSGNVGIGTPSPSASLEVDSATNPAKILVKCATGAPAACNGDITLQSGSGGTGQVDFNNSAGSIQALIGSLSGGSDLGFYTNGATQRMEITSAGNVGIGTTTPDKLLDVEQSANAATQIAATNPNAGSTAQAGFIARNNYTNGFFSHSVTSSGFSTSGVFTANEGYLQAGPDLTGGIAILTSASAPIRFATNGSSNERMRIDSNGNVGIGTTSPIAKLQIDGDVLPNKDNAYYMGTTTYRWAAVYSANGTIQTSDARLKTNVNDLNYGLSDLLKLRPVSFTWIAQPQQGTHLGFIAQEVQPLFPETVDVGDDVNHTLGLNYTEFIPVIVKSIQDIASISGTFQTNLIAWLGNSSNGIQDLFANNIYATNIKTHQLTADEVDSGQICATDQSGKTCITRAQLDELLAGQSGTAQSSGQGSGGVSGGQETSTPDTPPAIQVNGDNPATITVGANYNDLGATITGPSADLNLGITTYLNGTLTDPLTIDTTQPATDTISYVVTDQSSLAATSTRTVIIQTASDSGTATSTP